VVAGGLTAVAYWCCAQTAPMQEAAAGHFLALNGYTSYCPRLRVIRRSHGRKIETRPVLFPSYLFVLITSGWWTARWCPHVTRLLTGGGDAPLLVPDGIVDGLRAREVNGLVELPSRPDLKAGDKVKVTVGPMLGLEGLYAGTKPRQRVEILLQLFGSLQKVVLPKDSIERIGVDDSRSLR
jgi:transcriptional antiterminator RfaH